MTDQGGNVPAGKDNGATGYEGIADKTVILKWQAEIRLCLGNRIVLGTSSEITDNIARYHALAPEHIMRQKVVATLAAMHKNREIGRLKKHGEKSFTYGHRRYFEDDLKTPKQEYEELLSD